MKERLGLVIHWAGFIALVIVTMPFLTALPAWLISWILTGNKSFFPWKS
jgi:hypothetical protein